MRLTRLIFAAVVLAGGSSASAATQLDKQVCTDLKAEHGWLQQKGVVGDKAKGPDWAKAHLSGERLKEIERLISVEEQLAFRCPQPPRRQAPGDDEEGTAAAAGKAAKTKTAAKSGSAQAKRPAAETDAAPAAAPAKKSVRAAAAPGQDVGAAPAPRKAPKSKAKPDDAYSPAAAAAASGTP